MDHRRWTAFNPQIQHQWRSNGYLTSLTPLDRTAFNLLWTIKTAMEKSLWLIIKHCELNTSLWDFSAERVTVSLEGKGPGGRWWVDSHCKDYSVSRITSVWYEELYMVVVAPVLKQEGCRFTFQGLVTSDLHVQADKMFWGWMWVPKYTNVRLLQNRKRATFAFGILEWPFGLVEPLADGCKQT